MGLSVTRRPMERWPPISQLQILEGLLLQMKWMNLQPNAKKPAMVNSLPNLDWHGHLNICSFRLDIALVVCCLWADRLDINCGDMIFGKWILIRTISLEILIYLPVCVWCANCWLLSRCYEYSYTKGRLWPLEKKVMLLYPTGMQHVAVSCQSKKHTKEIFVKVKGGICFCNCDHCLTMFYCGMQLAC
jgi:hypothetical protein